MNAPRQSARTFKIAQGLLALAAFTLCCAAPAHAGELSGVWSGSYVCAQGETALALTIRDAAPDAPDGDIVAEFRFSALSTNPGVPDGFFTMRGSFDANTGAVALYGEQWRERPADYEMVNLIGQYDAADIAIAGRVEFPPWPEGCTVFRITRRPRQLS